MAETKKTEAAAAAAPPEAACLTLRQKLVEMRKACPEIVKKQHSDGVSYKYAKIYDVWEKITPIMNELGVDFDVISEQATRHAENGDPVYWITMQTKTRNGDKLMFLYIKTTGDNNVRCVRQGRELPREEIAAIFEPDEEGGEQE